MAKKILIVDDDRDLVKVMKIRFENDGYEVAVAYDGKECLEKARTEHPSLIISDVSMPKMDGYTVVKEIKADESLHHIPIIVLTGKDQMEDIFKVEGAEEFVVKPFEYDVLKEMVKKLLGTKQ